MASWNRVAAYAAALGGIVLAAAVDGLLRSYIGPSLAWAPVLVVVMFAARFAGFWPSVAALGAGLLVSLLFLEPFGSLAVHDVQDQGVLGLYLLLGGSVILLFESLRRARRRAADRARRVATLQHQLDRRGEELSKVSQRARSVIDHVIDGIITIDARATIESFNPAAERIFGYRAEEVVGRNVSMLMPEPYRSQHDGYVDNYLRTGKAKIIGIGREVVGQRQDGSTFPMDLAVSEYRSEGRRHFVGIVRDVTERKRVAEELGTAKEAAEEANRAKSQFLANISHELRTPMNAIVGMTELALDENLPRPAREYLKTVRESADLLLELLNELLDFSRIEAGRLELESAPFGLRELVAQTFKALGVRAYEKGLELAADVNAQVPDRIIGDSLRLRQVLVNLLGNGIKFTERGEVVLRVEVKRADAEETLLCFSVSDTGIGISAEDQTRIFAPFTQADASTTRHYGGTGLGLAISSNIVEQMGGQIWVESEPGRGSTFSFTARFALQPADAPPAGPSARVLERLRGARALVVDDNATNRHVLQEVLSQAGMATESADDATTALARIHAAATAGRPFLLVILDAIMPGIDGFTLAEWIKSDHRLSASTVLMLSSANRRMAMRRCERLHALYVEKPISPAELMEVIGRALGDKPSEGNAAPGPAPPPPPAVRSLRILLAEDTPANQRLVESILSKRGHSVVVVNNGREALEQVRSQPFDAVLMDVQMPVVDGLQATAEIRRLEDPGKSRVPIIAMTAHAMKGDRQRCLAAGMDGYVSKPVDRRLLLETIEQAAVPKRDRFAVTPVAVPPAEPSGQAVFDLGDSLSRLNGDMVLFQQLVDFFHEDYGRMAGQLRQGIELGDTRQVERVAHSLKGLAAGFNAGPATSAAAAMELLGREARLDEAARAIDELDRTFRALLDALAVYRPQSAANESTEPLSAE